VCHAGRFDAMPAPPGPLARRLPLDAASIQECIEQLKFLDVRSFLFSIPAFLFFTFFLDADAQHG